MTEIWAPKRIVIIGASGGIGGAVSNACEDRFPRSDIIGLSRKSSPKLDYADENTIRDAARHVGDLIDLVFVATGFLHNEDQKPEKSLRDLEADQLANAYLQNTIGPALVMKHFLPLMRRDKKSVLSILSARVGSISDNRLGGWYGYRSAKAGLNQMIKTASIEHGRRWKHGCVVGLHPGTVDTGLSKPFQGNVADGKLFTPDQSANYLLDVLEQIKATDSGKCFDWAGNEIPA